MKYSSGVAFRQALEDRLRTQSFDSGVPLIRLRKMVAFDRFLARLFADQDERWIVKGGFALQLRLGDRARTTKDIDLLILEQNQNILSTLRHVGTLDLGDWFHFVVINRRSNEIAQNNLLDFGGTRFQIQALLDGRTFERFHIDIGIGDPIFEPVEHLKTPDILAFAGVEPILIPCYPVSQQIAEKLHAYTRPYASGQSTRVKDFVDMLLLAELGTLQGATLIQAIKLTFDSRHTHPIPTTMPPLPKGRARAYRRILEEAALDYPTLDDANAAMKRFLNPLLGNKDQGRWDPNTWSWLEE